MSTPLGLDIDQLFNIYLGTDPRGFHAVAEGVLRPGEVGGDFGYEGFD